ncbi:MAG: homogentisate phytyltransferase [Leptolyngbyaceae cyanobacterium SL_7_1]|nr:homogentisate phytyltransferase [Leptolyngbyaceae cyanobacterium SL_7_1]
MRRISSQKPPSPDRTLRSPWMQRHAPWLYAFWKFSRPHTIIGTSLSVLGLYAIALSQQGLELEGMTAFLPEVMGTLLACLCGNVYIVGLNQLEDVSIDRINKPHLPLASGEFSRREALLIVGILGMAALLLSFWQGRFLFGMVGLSLLIGTAYSLPPIRLKRFPLLASLCIFTVRGVIVNLGLFLHFNQRLSPAEPDRWLQIPASVWALTLFVLVFTFAIAIFKDIPDLEGDRRYNINTFTLQLGAPAVFNLARWVLTICYVGMIVAGFFLASVHLGVLILTHAVALVALWIRSRQVDLKEKRSIARYYQFIWKLFFLEYIMFPIACLLA